MQLHYKIRDVGDYVFLAVISQEHILETPLAECSIGEWFACSRACPQLAECGIYLRGWDKDADHKEVRSPRDMSINPDDARRALEIFVLIKDARTKRMYERIN